MKEASLGFLRSSLLSGLILSSCALPAYAFYHPDQGRWLSRDPIEETGGRNLYGFCNNRAIMLVDRDGREIVFVGDDAAVNAAKAALSKVREKANDELKKLIDDMEKDSRTCKIKVTYDSKMAIVGSYAGEEIDLGDIAKFPETGGAGTQDSKVIHEVVEQWEKQINKKAYQTAHKEGVKAEQNVTGSIRGSQGSTIINADGSITIPVTWTRQIENDKDGKKTSVTKTTIQSVTVKDGNVTSVQETQK